jgi:hypothetical protein
MIENNSKINEKKNDFIEHVSNARIYTKSVFEVEGLGSNEFSTISKSGNYVLTYSTNDIDYMNDALEYLEQEHYMPRRSIEDQIFDDYERLACKKETLIMQMMIKKAAENEIFEEFRDSSRNLPLDAYFNKIDAGNKGSKVIFTPASENIQIDNEGNQYRSILVVYKLNKSQKGV